MENWFALHFQRSFFHKQDYKVEISLLGLGKSYNVIVKLAKFYHFYEKSPMTCLPFHKTYLGTR